MIEEDATKKVNTEKQSFAEMSFNVGNNQERNGMEKSTFSELIFRNT